MTLNLELGAVRSLSLEESDAVLLAHGRSVDGGEWQQQLHVVEGPPCGVGTIISI